MSCNPPSVSARHCDSSMNLTRKVTHNEHSLFFIRHEEIAAKMLEFYHLSTAESLCTSLMSSETISIDEASWKFASSRSHRGISSLLTSRFDDVRK